MKPYNSFCFKFTLVFTTLMASAFGFNGIIDPYGIMGAPRIKSVNHLKTSQVNNARLYKAVSIINQSQIDILLIGTSRVQQGMNPETLELVQDSTIYNAGMSALTPYEALAYIQHAYYNHPEIETVLLGLDFWVFEADNKTVPGFEEYRLHQRHLDVRDILKFNLSRFSILDSLDTLRFSRQHPELIAYEDNGFYDSRADQFSDNYRADRPWEQVFFQWVRGSRQENASPVSAAQLGYLEEIIEFCRVHNIELVLFTTPEHALGIYALERSGKLAAYEAWKEDIARLSPFWDFTDFNSVVTEPAQPGMENYIDTSHFTPVVGNWMLARMLDPLLEHRVEGVPADFGVQVDASNRVEHFRAVEARYEAWKQTAVSELQLVDQRISSGKAVQRIAQ